MSEADALHYHAMKEAESNNKRFSQEYIKLKFLEAITTNTKFYFGNSIP